MPEKLFLLMPLVKWVRGTIEKMNVVRSKELKDWKVCWLQMYMELGGKSCKHLTGKDGSGDKRCPMDAAYGLWRLGRIKGSGKSLGQTLKQVDESYGPNAVYAVLVLDLLEKNPTAIDWNQDAMWCSVRDSYRRDLGKEAAGTAQGALQIALGLFSEKQIVPTG